MKTRTSKETIKTVAEATEITKSATPKVQLEPETTNPPLLFIFPESASSEARIVSIENPRYAEDDRYLVCPENGFYEFTRLAAPKRSPRSCLLTPKENESDDGEDKKGTSKGFVTKTAELCIATSIDPLFFLLPALAPRPKSNSSEPAKKLFLSADDYLERLATTSADLRSLIRIQSLRTRLEQRMAAVCDTVDAGDETMYRLNEAKLLKELLNKARKTAEKGLPASMEEKLIRKALEVPMMSIKRDNSSLSELVNEEIPVRADSEVTTPDTQTTAATTNSTTTSFSEALTAATSFSEHSASQTPNKLLPPINAPTGVADLLRLQTALFFTLSAYVAPHLTSELKKSLDSSSSPMYFEPLTLHLEHLTKLRQEAMATRSLGDYSRKRFVDEDDEGSETRAEKKRKKDEEEKRKKAGESRGVRDLKKVNVTGMKKMSDFFKKNV